MHSMIDDLSISTEEVTVVGFDILIHEGDNDQRNEQLSKVRSPSIAIAKPGTKKMVYFLGGGTFYA